MASRGIGEDEEEDSMGQFVVCSVLMVLCVGVPTALADTPPLPPIDDGAAVESRGAEALLPGESTVYEFGAVGDGVTDDTEAFQRALDAAGETGGGVVKAGVGTFLIKGNLVFPDNVTLEGVWRAPVRGVPFTSGTTLLAVADKGNPDGPPFIKLNTSSVLKGVTIYYPEQIQENPPHAYPWTVQGEGDNCTILSVTMINPYKAVDFGSLFCGRHYINGLYAHALYKGLYIDQCYDVGRIENIHFWPFWTVATEGPLYDFTYENGTAFIIGRTDGEMGLNLFQIFYNIGFHFVDTGHGGGSGTYTNVYSDVTPVAVQVDATHQHAPVSFVNSSFMSAVNIDVESQAVVNMTGCGFWDVRDVEHHIRIQGPAVVNVSSCTFYRWDRQRQGAAAIEAEAGSVIVTGSNFFMDRDGAVKVRLGDAIRSAVVVGNIMRGGVVIDDQTGDDADVQIGLNAGK